MRIVKIILGAAALFLLGSAGWQIGSAEVANMNLQEEMRDLAAQAGTRVGFVTPKSDEEMKLAVILKAKEHGINLNHDQATVRRTNPGESSTLHLAADYTVRVNLGPLAFSLHFAPSSDK